MPYFTRFTDTIRVKFKHGEFAKLHDATVQILYDRSLKRYSDTTHEVFFFSFPQWGIVKPHIPGSANQIKPRKIS